MQRHLNKFIIYAADESLRCRLSQMSSNLYTNLQTYTIYGLYQLNGSLLSTVRMRNVQLLLLLLFLCLFLMLLQMMASMITFIVILIQYSLGDDCSTPSSASASASTAVAPDERADQ
ncbi:uncharacterized protein LOC117569681 isoform X1 [Drosophila albomicans]|uniref:Uncharacterized protein LOC117569681 isoform X1 n=1 Tax=Drosophila albomicans TaxID=7291 RepID=A0A9C6WDV3_DROAB|nr:uncharacterized protein LOC117569681 isoform X1 [Drosophila albomicans]